jgi:glycosyltransferase involved in cell wall biosynthesis
MRVAVTTDHRFFRTPDGAVWTDGINSYEFWTRYLKPFDEVKVLARVKPAASPGPGYQLASGAGVVFVPLPDYWGPAQYVSKALAIQSCIRQALAARDAVILRVSSHIANCAASVLRLQNRPYGLEVVNDPYDVFTPGAVRYRARPVFRWWFTRELRRQCRDAAGVAYVTDQALQQRYPCPAYSIALSDVEIPSAAIADRPRYQSRIEPSTPLRLITVASLAQIYKAPDILIRAVAECVKAGLNLTLEILGDGRYRPELELLAADLGLRDRVRFAGRVPAGEAVRKRLDTADLFILPSRCEGMPRAMIEAMARALPCIGSSVGGIPELLAAEDLFPAGSVPRLGEKIMEVVSSPHRLTAMSHRNLLRSADFRDDRLEPRRRAFLDHIRDATASWIQRSGEAASLAKREEVQPC